MEKKKDKEEVTSPGKNMVDLTGHWFVYFGASSVVVEDTEGKREVTIEGSRILTLQGAFDPETFIVQLRDGLIESFPQNAKDILKGQPHLLTIRAFNRIDPPGVVSAVAV